MLLQCIDVCLLSDNDDASHFKDTYLQYQLLTLLANLNAADHDTLVYSQYLMVYMM